MAGALPESLVGGASVAQASSARAFIARIERRHPSRALPHPHHRVPIARQRGEQRLDAERGAPSSHVHLRPLGRGAPLAVRIDPERDYSSLGPRFTFDVPLVFTPPAGG